MRVHTPPRQIGADWLLQGDEVAMWHQVSNTGKMLPCGSQSSLIEEAEGDRWSWWTVTDVRLGDGALVSMKPPPSAQLGEVVYTLDLPHGYGVVVRVPVDVDPWDLSAEEVAAAAVAEVDPAPVVDEAAGSASRAQAADLYADGRIGRPDWESAQYLAGSYPPVRELVAERFPGGAR